MARRRSYGTPAGVRSKTGSAGTDPKAEDCRRAVAVAGGVDREDAEDVSPRGSEVGAWRATNAPGLAVELAVEAGSGLGGGEGEGDPTAGARGEEQRRWVTAQVGRRRSPVRFRWLQGRWRGRFRHR